MKRTLLIDGVTYFFILLFLYTGGEKLMEINSFKDQLTSSPLLGSVAGVITWALPITEILIAIVLFVPAWKMKGLYASLILMVLFTIYLITLLAIDDHISCSCGGIIENLSPKQHIFFNAAVIAMAVLAIAAAKWQQPTALFRRSSGIAGIVLLAGIAWIIVSAFRTPGKVRTGMEGRLLPAFTLLLPDSVTRLNTADIPTGKPFIMIGFSPYCTHCQHETMDIIKHIQQFRGASIYLVTIWPYADLKKFYHYYHLEKYPNIVAAVDTKNAFLSNLQAKGVPYITIYDAKKRLKEVVPGEADALKLSKELTD